jgi:hypothetical protein
MNLRNRLTSIASTAALLTAIPLAAHADPTQGEAFTLDCGDAGTIEITTPPGNGPFTPGFFTDSQDLIIPLAFDISGTATLPDGEVIPLFSDSFAKGHGNANPNRDTLTCTISEEETITDPDDESGLPVGTVISFGGTVTGFLTGNPA